MPYSYSVNSSKITRTAELDVRAQKQDASTFAAMTKFQNLARFGSHETKDRRLDTLHQNCISQILPYQGTAVKGVTSFATVGFDSKLAIWPIKVGF